MADAQFSFNRTPSEDDPFRLASPRQLKNALPYRNRSAEHSYISTAKIDEAAHKTSGFQKERRKYGPMGYKSFLTQYVAVGHSISRTSFTYLLFSVAQVGIPGVSYTFRQSTQFLVRRRCLKRRTWKRIT